MAGNPTKKGSWGDWAIIEPKPNQHRITCSFCAFYMSDGSCSIHPIVVKDLGYNYWRNCDSFFLNMDHDTTELRNMVNRIKTDESPYQSYNASLYQSLHKKAYDDVTKSNVYSPIEKSTRISVNNKHIQNSPYVYVNKERLNSTTINKKECNPPKRRKSKLKNPSDSAASDICRFLVGDICHAFNLICTKSKGYCLFYVQKR